MLSLFVTPEKCQESCMTKIIAPMIAGIVACEIVNTSQLSLAFNHARETYTRYPKVVRFLSDVIAAVIVHF